MKRGRKGSGKNPRWREGARGEEEEERRMRRKRAPVGEEKEGGRERRRRKSLKAMGRQKSTVLKAPHGLAVEVHE